MVSVSKVVGRFLPGIVLLICLGVLARFLSRVVGFNYLIVAIALGVLLANTFGVPGWAEDGVGTQNVWLETGIVLMGSQLSIDVVLQVGPRILGLVVVTMATTALLAELLARRLFGIEKKLGSLLAAGTSICGVSAIIAVAGSIKPDERHFAYAVATILLFDALTVFLYPLLGSSLGLSETVYGVWAGLTMFSTGPAIAAGFAHSDAAGQLATVTKLSRNLFLALFAIGYSLYYTRKAENETFSLLWTKFPKFIVGFIAMMLIASTGVLDAEQLTSLENAFHWLFLFAFAGLGLTITVDEFRTVGLRPVVLVLSVFSIISALGLTFVKFMFAF